MSRFLFPFLCAAAALHAGDDRVVRGLNQFGIACYHEVEQEGPNLIFSPFSLSSALSMILAGAGGNTALELAAVLHQSYPDPRYPDVFSTLAGQLLQRANTGGNEMLNASGLWVQRGFRLEPDFQRTVETTYAAPLVSLDFARSPESARSTINSWTGQHTKGKIPKLFAAGSLDSRTRLVLTSAIYFYGKWERPFSAGETRPGRFTPGAGGTVETPFMHQTARFGYAETPHLQILELRYAGKGLAWDVLLPKANDGLADLEKSLTPDTLEAWLGTLSPHTVEVAFPKFRSQSEFSLRAALSRMGMPSAFGGADFSGIDGRRDLALADVVHKAYVDVSETGTEAAAATGSTAVLVSLINPEHKIFRADHAFVFLIRDTQTGLILFAGRLVNPAG